MAVTVFPDLVQTLEGPTEISIAPAPFPPETEGNVRLPPEKFKAFSNGENDRGF